ncbi:MAG: response regulator [Flavobacteriales bacterium]
MFLAFIDKRIPLTMFHRNVQHSEAALTPTRALVVDDQVDIATSLALLLKHLGYSVQVAHSANEATMVGEDFRPDVIFLDIGLPDNSGYEVCKAIRGSDWGPVTFIVALTGRDEPEDLIRAANTGFDRYVVKPMNVNTLKEILEVVKSKSV